MASFAIHPPVHLTLHTDEPIRTIEAAAKIVQRHRENAPGAEAALVLAELEGASTPAAAERAGEAFRQWAAHEGLLLRMPDDRPRQEQAPSGGD